MLLYTDTSRLIDQLESKVEEETGYEGRTRLTKIKTSKRIKSRKIYIHLEAYLIHPICTHIMHSESDF
jgi:hypothetical protein